MIYFCKHVSFQIKTTVIAHSFLVFLSTFQTQPIKRTECCVLETPITPGPQYLILSTYHVFSTVDMSFITTTELTNRFLMGILRSPTTKSVKWRFTVLEIFFLLFPFLFVCIIFRIYLHVCLSFHNSFLIKILKY